MDMDAVTQINHSDAGHLRILVADDDELNRRMMEAVLARLGHDVEFASNGLEALDAIKYRKFDIVFMDLQMPVMDGIESSRRIREWENENSRTFIVALTASYLPENGQTLFEAGIDNYIAKPFELDHIQRMLNYMAEAILVSSTGTNVVPVEEISIVEILDIQKGIRRVGGDSGIYWNLLSDFVQELPVRLGELQRFFITGDLEGLSRAAHNLKGVSANLGALQLSEYGKRLEKQCGAGYTENIKGSFEELSAAGYQLYEIGQLLLSGSGFRSE